jgi:hypothetical protein
MRICSDNLDFEDHPNAGIYKYNIITHSSKYRGLMKAQWSTLYTNTIPNPKAPEALTGLTEIALTQIQLTLITIDLRQLRLVKGKFYCR